MRALFHRIGSGQTAAFVKAARYNEADDDEKQEDKVPSSEDQ
jgi:hypothetical protein